MIRQAGVWRFDALIAGGFLLLVLLIVAGSARQWWRLLRGTQSMVLQESEFVALTSVNSSVGQEA